MLLLHLEVIGLVAVMVSTFTCGEGGKMWIMVQIRMEAENLGKKRVPTCGAELFLRADFDFCLLFRAKCTWWNACLGASRLCR